MIIIIIIIMIIMMMMMIIGIIILGICKTRKYWVDVQWEIV